MSSISIGMYNIGAEQGRLDGALRTAQTLMNQKNWSMKEALDVVTTSPEDRSWVEERLLQSTSETK